MHTPFAHPAHIVVSKAFVWHFLILLIREPMVVQINQSTTEVTSRCSLLNSVHVESIKVDRCGLRTPVFREDIERKQIAGGAFETVVAG